MVILLGTMCACVVSATFGLPVTQVGLVGFVSFVILVSAKRFAALVGLAEDPSENEVPTYDFPFVTRAEWNARPAKQVTRLATPVPFVVIHHSHNPGACVDNDQCSQAMRAMQNYHMNDHGWWDIGYNFAVGGNGKAYEGRGWYTVGAQALHFNTVSIGICLIGNWKSELPPAVQIKTAQKLIEAGVALGLISQKYKLIGHRQVRDTECPGDALFEEIQTWPHYSPFPKSVKDLVDIQELPESVKNRLRNKTETT